MKRLTPYLIVLLFVLIIVTLFLSFGKVQAIVTTKDGNVKQLPLNIELNMYKDSYCGVLIDDKTYLCEVVSSDGKTWFFYDVGGLVHWLEDKPFKKSAVIWVMSRDSEKWIDARKAYYSTDEPTPSGYGFGAYEKRQKGLIRFKDMSYRVLHKETLKDKRNLGN